MALSERVEGAERISMASVKRQEILAAATSCFLEAGYEGTSMDAVAQRAGVSKRTIYDHFGSKNGLFQAIAHDRCEAFLEPLLSYDMRSEPVREVLTLLARRFLRGMLSPTSLALYRLLIAEAQRFPELSRAAYDAGPADALATLSNFLEERTATGELNIANAPVAAEQFFGMITGLFHFRALLNVGQDGVEADGEAALAHAVDTFLRAFSRSA